MSDLNERNKKIIAEFRANEGKVGGNFEGKLLLLLHTIGAKSGQERVNPLACIRDGERLAIIASKGGAPTHPDWYYNVLANPLVTAEVGTETFQAQATVTEEPERTRLYDKMAKMMPGFNDFESTPFEKRSQRTRQGDIELARSRFRLVERSRLTE